MKLEEEHKLRERASLGRSIGHAESFLVPLLREAQEDTVALMCAEFAAGRTDFVAKVAKLDCLRELEETLKNKKQAGDRAAKELQNGNG